jgi:hypothetical protein
VYASRDKGTVVNRQQRGIQSSACANKPNVKPKSHITASLARGKLGHLKLPVDKSPRPRPTSRTSLKAGIARHKELTVSSLIANTTTEQWVWNGTVAKEAWSATSFPSVAQKMKDKVTEPLVSVPAASPKRLLRKGSPTVAPLTSSLQLPAVRHVDSPTRLNSPAPTLSPGPTSEISQSAEETMLRMRETFILKQQLRAAREQNVLVNKTCENLRIDTAE